MTSFTDLRTTVAEVISDQLDQSVSVYRSPSGQMQTPAVVVATVKAERSGFDVHTKRVELFGLASASTVGNVEQAEQFIDPDHAWSLEAALERDSRTLGAFAVVESSAAEVVSWAGVEYFGVRVTVDVVD